jgi:hypothetical protein
MGFSLVAWKREPRDEAVNGRWQNSPAFRLPVHHQKLRPFPISCISMHSHIIFSDIVEETYNKDPSLCMYLKKKSHNSMCCLQRCEEHYLNPGYGERGTMIGMIWDARTNSGKTCYLLDVSDTVYLLNKCSLRSSSVQLSK